MTTASKVALRSSEQQRRRQASELVAVLNATHAQLALLDSELRFVMVNDAYERACGHSRQELIGRPHFELFPHEENERIFRRVLSSGEPLLVSEKAFEFPLQPERGITYWDWSLVPVRSDEGEVHGVLLSLLDVTEHVRARRASEELAADRTRAEREARERETRARDREHWLQTVVDTIPHMVWTAAPDGAFESVNSQILAYTGASAAQLLGTGWTEYVHPDDRASAHEVWGRILASGRGETATVRIRRRDGEYRWFEINSAPLQGEGGRVDRWIGTCTDVDDRRRTEEALRDSDRRKSEFLALLSHELRNPLAPIRNAIHILNHADATGEQASRAKALIQRQTEQLTRLVDDLLDVTRIARGKIELRRARVDLADVARRAADDHGCVLEERGVALSVDVPAAPLWVEGDAARLSQVLGNVLHNAAKFTDRGGSVLLSVGAGTGTAEIHVADTGVGMEPGLLRRVFEPFVQAERSLERNEGGLGLGLALAKMVVELHGGTVRAESAGVGRGTEIVIDLPLACVAPPAEVSRRAAPRSHHPRRVLVVDDNADAAESLAEIVELLGHAVEIAFDGPSAVAKARASSPEVVLCDIGLPGMNGYEVATALRAGGLGGRLVALTGYARPEDLKRAEEAGFDAHLAKPADPDDIARLLEE